MKQYGVKYQFQGTRAEQDFFVLLDAEHHDELFYVVSGIAQQVFEWGGGELKKDA